MANAQSLTSPLQQEHRRRRVLVTGAAGRIGRAFAEFASTTHQLRLLDRPGARFEGLAELGEVVVCDVQDLPSLTEACRHVDTVVHLAGNPDPSAAWSELIGPNVVGVYNMFAAAKAADCRRVVFASSIHAVMGYPSDRQVATTDPVNPLDVYGVTKCFGEAMGKYVAEQEGISVIALRLGAFLAPEVAMDPDSAHVANIFLAPEDLFHLLLKSIDVEGIRFGIFHAISDNSVKRLDVSDTRSVLGYNPVYNFAALAPNLAPIAAALGSPPSPPASGPSRDADDPGAPTR
jgi:uronate dehydrogenase